ncbi:asparaginase [Cytobacillus purgationiresistens]|uniref:L-asparaginase II n=1 Tax=Cytobacillus purgationiresistens TaxID=863449 RepID=A0ABU0AH41_9BACI|nr:asparaginase [Cytobacillus purgationiresistens]MDQ0270581.1 L-asparaginase II [Cytobacillus purgationiresistens]
MHKPIKVYRGEYLESAHDIHIAVVNVKGELLYSYGNPDKYVFPRSSMKPFQAIAVLETGAVDVVGMDDRELSLICASHNGEAMHRTSVMSILSKVELEESALQCGTHIPRDMASYHELIRDGGQLTPVFSNCSGKHAGMLTAVAHMKEDIAAYREIDHPHQQRILNVIEKVCHFPSNEIGISVDGCGVPVHRLPLRNTALGYASLALSTDIHPAQTAEYLDRVKKAMVTYPEMVAGTDRFDTDLMKVFGGRLVAKTGAEGVQCIGDSETGIGIAIKAEDGNGRAVSVATMEVLKQLNIGEEGQYRQLSQYITAPVLNARQAVIGRIEADFQLKAEKMQNIE